MIAKYKKIAGAFIVGIKDFEFSRELESFLKEFQIAGLALFNSPYDSPHNIWKDPEQALERVYEFNAKALRFVSFIAADQEGGRVRRLRAPFIHLPSAQRITESYEETGDLKSIKKLYELAAEQMKLAGIILNFAPVCDLRYPESHHVVGDRSFGTKASEVVKWAGLFCDAFETAGVKTTLKHLPGHGPSQRDSHEEVAVLFKTKEDLWKSDFQVFKELSSHASAVMTAHLAYEESSDRIFSLDKEFLTECREVLPDSLLWITDDLLSMGAVKDEKPWLKAFDLHYDYLLVCGSLDEAAAAIEETIRHLENKSLNFTEEERLDRRLHRSLNTYKTQVPMRPWKEWKSKILEMEKKGLEILEALKIKN